MYLSVGYHTKLSICFHYKFLISVNVYSERMVEIRTILERMRPVEHKLKYQIEKLLKLSSSGKLGENDPLQFKANPDNLISKVLLGIYR